MQSSFTDVTEYIIIIIVRGSETVQLETLDKLHTLNSPSAGRTRIIIKKKDNAQIIIIFFFFYRIVKNHVICCIFPFTVV